MDEEHIRGSVDKLKGSMKDVAGLATGNRKLQVEGKVDKTKGGFRTMLGDIKDLLRGRR